MPFGSSRARGISGRNNGGIALSGKEPKYVSIIQHLRRQIIDGKLQPGMRLVPQAQLAAGFGVSLATTRQALGELEAEGLIEQMRGHGTFVAKRRRAQAFPTASIGFLLIEAKDSIRTNTYYMGLIRAMGEALSTADYDLKVAAVSDAAFRQRQPHRMLERQRIRAVVLDGHVTQLHVDLIRELGLDVWVAGNHPLHEQVPQVRHDVKQAALLLGREMLSLEHGPLILLTEPYRLFYTTEILLGYQQGMREVNQCPSVFSAMPNDYEVWSQIIDTIARQHGDQFSLMTTLASADTILERCSVARLDVQRIPTCIIGDNRNRRTGNPALQPWIISCELSGELIGRTIGERLVASLNEDQPIRGATFAPVVKRVEIAKDKGWPIVCEWRPQPQNDPPVVDQ